MITGDKIEIMEMTKNDLKNKLTSPEEAVKTGS